MVDRLRGWLKTLDFRFQQKSRSASKIIDRRTEPQDVEATRFTPLADQPHHEVSPFHPSREGSPETPVEDTTGTLTTHSNVGRKFGSSVLTIHQATAPQEIYTLGGFDAAVGNTSRFTAINGAIADGTTNILTAEGPQKPKVNPEVPYALTWMEHDVELKYVKATENSGLESSDTSLTSDDDDMGHVTRGFFLHSCTAIPNSDGELIIFGGSVEQRRSEEEYLTNDVVLLSATDMSFTSLETSGAKPRARYGHRAVIAGRVLVVFGGGGHDSYMHFLNLDTREWSRFRPPAPYPDPRVGPSFILVDNTIWLYGGGGLGTATDDMWCIDLGNDDIEYARWRQIPKKEPWPEARAYHSTVYYAGSLYLYAGEDIDSEEEKVYLNDVWKFEIRAETWTKIQCHGLLPQPRSAHDAAVIGDNMFTFGGYAGGKGSPYLPTDHAFVFNLQDHTWRSLAMLGRTPLPTVDGTLLAFGLRLILLGGQEDKRSCIHTAETRAGT